MKLNNTDLHIANTISAAAQTIASFALAISKCEPSLFYFSKAELNNPLLLMKLEESLFQLQDKTTIIELREKAAEVNKWLGVEAEKGAIATPSNVLSLAVCIENLFKSESVVRLFETSSSYYDSRLVSINKFLTSCIVLKGFLLDRIFTQLLNAKATYSATSFEINELTTRKGILNLVSFVDGIQYGTYWKKNSASALFHLFHSMFFGYVTANRLVVRKSSFRLLDDKQQLNNGLFQSTYTDCTVLNLNSTKATQLCLDEINAYLTEMSKKVEAA